MGPIKCLERWVLEPATFLAQRFKEEIDRLEGGDPPSPMHPLPADDGVLLRRRARKKTDGDLSG